VFYLLCHKNSSEGFNHKSQQVYLHIRFQTEVNFQSKVNLAVVQNQKKATLLMLTFLVIKYDTKFWQVGDFTRHKNWQTIFRQMLLSYCTLYLVRQ